MQKQMDEQTEITNINETRTNEDVNGKQRNTQNTKHEKIHKHKTNKNNIKQQNKSIGPKSGSKIASNYPRAHGWLESPGRMVDCIVEALAKGKDETGFGEFAGVAVLVVRPWQNETIKNKNTNTRKTNKNKQKKIKNKNNKLRQMQLPGSCGQKVFGSISLAAQFGLQPWRPVWFGDPHPQALPYWRLVPPRYIFLKMPQRSALPNKQQTKFQQYKNIFLHVGGVLGPQTFSAGVLGTSFKPLQPDLWRLLKVPASLII
jgi:hypothetical protein